MQPLPSRNPFRSTIATDPRQPPAVDVRGIHQRAFDKCIAAVDRVRANRSSAAVLINGVPGAGKTHLLARLRKHLDVLAKSDYGALSVNVMIRMNASPRRLWQHVREEFVEELLRKFSDDKTYLAWITAKKLSETGSGSSAGLWHSYLIQPEKDEEGIAEFLDETMRDRNLSMVLQHLFLGRHRLDAKAWLRGDSLPEAALEKMRVGRDATESSEPLEDRAREIVRALCRLGASLPFVFCFDQIEALRTEANPEIGLDLFGRMIADLLDENPNAVAISCVQTAFLTDLRRYVREADRDRFMREVVLLDELSTNQCGELASQLLDSEPELAALEARKSARGVGKLWPLDETALKKKLSDGPRTPRRLIAACSELYEQARESKLAPPPQALDDFLDSEWSKAFKRGLAEDSVENSSGVLKDGLPEAMAVFAPEWRAVEKPDVRDEDVEAVYENAEFGRIGWSIFNQTNMRAFFAHLDRLRKHLEETSKKYERFVILRHPSAGIKKSAYKTFEHIDALRKLGAQVMPPVSAALAALAALRDVLAAAKSGDLACGGEAVQIDSVRSWLKAHQPQELETLLREILPEGKAKDDPDAELTQALLAWFNAHPVARLDEAAGALKREKNEVQKCVERHPEHFGCLNGGTAPVIFLAVRGTAS